MRLCPQERSPCQPSLCLEHQLLFAPPQPGTNHHLALPPGAQQVVCLPALRTQVLSQCARMQLASWGVHTKAANRHKTRHLHSAEASKQLVGCRILQERHAAGNAFPKAGIPQLTLCSLASTSLPAGSAPSLLLHLVLFHPRCPQFTHFSCLLCPLIPGQA